MKATAKKRKPAAKPRARKAPATHAAGYSGTATAGYCGIATAGDRGEIRIRYYDPKSDRYRAAVACVGEDGIEPNTAYVLDDAHRFVRKPGGAS